MSSTEPPIPPGPGWYPDPAGITRWFDGTHWTSHTQAAPAPPHAALHPSHQVPSPAMSHFSHGGLTQGQHLQHLVLTLITCGCWGPVWAWKAWSSQTRTRVHYR